MKKVSRQKALIAVLAVLLIFALSYIAFDAYQQGLQQDQLRLFQQAAQFGYEQAILQVMQQASTCQPVPLFADNITMNLVSVECIQKLP